MNLRSFIKVLSIIALVLLFCILACQGQALKKAERDAASNVDNDNSSGGPVIVENVNPVYPEQALREGTEGVVWVKVAIDSTGKVTDATIVKDSGKDVGFEEAALKAAYKTKWAPALEKGRPTAIYVTYKIEFAIRKK